MTDDKRVTYTAKAHTTGGREGASSTDDGHLNVKLTSPGGPGTNPEQLFAVGWSACYLSALHLLAKKMNVTLPPDASNDVEIDLLLGPDGYSLRARHNVHLPGVDPEAAQKLVEAGHTVCPYSKATHGNISVETRLV